MRKTIIFVLSTLGLIVLMLISIGGEIYLRWHNPDMTETRLFLTYWKFYVSITVLFLVFSISFSATRD